MNKSRIIFFKTTPGICAVLLVAVLALSACNKKVDGTPGTSGTQPGAAGPPAGETVMQLKAATDKWLGKWAGPGETYLNLEDRGAVYLITIRAADSLATYEGSPAINRIKFQRSGESETIRAGSAKDAGVEALAGKSGCLVVKTGEAYCR
ncbi:MAG: hypothetical protein H7332_00510 [Bdellovibrionales bacterium]|nr:hypothetical protein [Ramlibacter sp.]